MSADYIHRTYGVPTKRGTRIVYLGNDMEQGGVITGVRGAYLRIRLDGEDDSRSYHPTWCLRFPGALAQQEKAGADG